MALTRQRRENLLALLPSVGRSSFCQTLPFNTVTGSSASRQRSSSIHSACFFLITESSSRTTMDASSEFPALSPLKMADKQARGCQYTPPQACHGLRFDLIPSELRIRVYEHLFRGCALDMYSVGRDWTPGMVRYPGQRKCQAKLPNILRVCRLFYHEAKELMYRFAAFTIHDLLFEGSLVTKSISSVVESAGPLMTKSISSFIETLVIDNCWFRKIPSLEADFPSLRLLTVKIRYSWVPRRWEWGDGTIEDAKSGKAMRIVTWAEAVKRRESRVTKPRLSFVNNPWFPWQTRLLPELLRRHSGRWLGPMLHSRQLNKRPPRFRMILEVKFDDNRHSLIPSAEPSVSLPWLTQFDPSQLTAE